MPFHSRHLAVGVLLIAGLSTPFAPAKKKDNPAGAMDEQKRAIHALNRLTFGPRPGDVQRVMQIGVDKWIDLQLHPERIDDSALEARLAPFRTLRMDTKELVENFPPNQLIRRVANGKASLPSDPTKRAVYEMQLQRYQDKKDRKEESVKDSAEDPAMVSADGENKHGGRFAARSSPGKPPLCQSQNPGTPRTARRSALERNPDDAGR